MITLRPYQARCKTAFYDYYERGNGKNGLIVVPTAGGKSLIIGGLATEIVQKWNSQRILILSHVQELIEQNASKVMLCWSNAPAGVYSAGLGKRHAHHPIITASIQSVYKKSFLLGHRDLVFIDEAHLLQPGMMGMYGKLLSELMEINPRLKVCGFTATDYRADSGALTGGEDALFNDVIIEISIQELLEEGYLTPPIGKGQLIQADMKGVKIDSGTQDFNMQQMAARFGTDEFIKAALDNDMPFLEGRKSIAIFCPTVEIAERVADELTARGIACESLDGEMSKDIRRDKLERFRNYQLRALASVGVITTGTDIPNIDCLILWRAMAGSGLYKQIFGRGFRVMYTAGYDLETREGRLNAIKFGPKPNFLILDHGGNLERHGAITHVSRPEPREKGERRKIIPSKVRICEACRTAWPLEVTICGLCETVLVNARDATASLSVEASDAEVMGTPFSRGEIAQWFNVDEVRYSRHQKAGKPDSLKVTYYCGILQFNEWIAIEAKLANTKKWWGARTMAPYPETVMDALKVTKTLKAPLRVQVWKRKEFYEVLRYEFTENRAFA